MNLDKALAHARLVLREPTTFVPATHPHRIFLQWFVDTMGVDQGCGAVDPAIGQDADGQPAVLIPDEWVGHYTPDETLGKAGALVRAAEAARKETP